MLPLQDYALEETLYEGPETIIQRATHLPSGERRVVKLPISEAPNARIVGRLVHEHQILIKLKAVAGVSQPRALEQRGGSVALVLKDAGLRSLDRVFAERGRLPMEAVLRIALRLCRVLEGVHAAGIMHKDIKPQNILVDDACQEVVLVDFGIAAELTQEMAEVAFPETLEGTLAYISPEQTGRTARGLDVRTDLYSLGVLLFEALSGRRPFLEKDALALVYAHLAKAPPLLENLVPNLPKALARIIERCLEKSPEDRYQTAKGLGADLARALEQWTERGQIEPFALGQKDFSPKLQISQTLVNREQESQALAAAFERAAGGTVEILLLGGPSGVGKTALVRSVYREIAKANRGLLLTGKHDQLGRSAPYASLAQAFSGLLNNLAASPKPVFESWRIRLSTALGPNARVIADLVPELEWLLGPLAPVPVVPTEMAYNRLKLSWLEFVRAVTEASPPLVLFLDDMQWVDQASLELLKVLLTDGARKNLLLIAAFRDNEVDSSHPLWNLIEAVQQSGLTVPHVAIGPLPEAAVQEWLSVTLCADMNRVKPLAAALWLKTQGNPFFLSQLLLELYRQKLIWRDLDNGIWEWDQNAVERAQATSNVVELMRSKVIELPLGTQVLLGQAACMGHSFSFDELTVLSGKSQPEVAMELWPAVTAGLVIPSDGQYREMHALLLMQQSSELEAHYRFLHDRVQQAFYEGIALPHRSRTHLQIGRRLQQAFSQGGSSQKQLEMLRHLNLGAKSLSSDEECTELAKLNLLGAHTAKLNGSYQLQAQHVEQGLSLLGERGLEKEPRLYIELSIERIEAHYMLREFAEVHSRAKELLELPLPALPRLAVHELRIRTCLASGQFDEGGHLGRLALAEHGIYYPESDEGCATLALQLVEVCDAWLDKHPEGLDSFPADPSIEHLLMDAIEVAMMISAAIGSHHGMGALGITRPVHQLLERGMMTAVAPFFVSAFAQVRSSFLGDYRGGARWTREGERAAARLASPLFPECSCVRGQYIPYEHPVEQSRPFYQAALRTATASGSFQGTSWALYGELHYYDLWSGRPLSQVSEKEAWQRHQMNRSGDAVGQHYFALAASYADFLRNPQSAQPLPEQEWLATSSRQFLALGDGLLAEFARIHEAHLFLAFGKYRQALERADEAESFRHRLFGMLTVTYIPLWRGLAAAKCWTAALAADERGPLLDRLDQAIERYRYLAQGCMSNFGHMLRLLEAERARILGDSDAASSAYDDAIEQAQQQGFLHIEALAAQFCADFHLAASRKRHAAYFLRQACDAYRRWDALAIVSHLQVQHSALLHAPSTPSADDLNRTIFPTSSTTTGNTGLDVHTTIRAAQALASELSTDLVVAQLMKLVQENAGAQTAALVLSVKDSLLLTALISDSKVYSDMSEALTVAHPIAQSVIQFILRTRESVLLTDAPADPRFASDPHLRAAAIRSVLAVPLLHQGRLAGLLYLEHQAPNAFPPARVTLLGVLASQSAIALENARLYQDLQAANIGLEQKVKERTAALDSALHELWSEMDLAKKIQTVLLPANPQIPHYELSAIMRPADLVGGDYYDVFHHGDGDWVLIGDVSGHGISAGLCMMMIQTALRTAALTLERAGQPLTPRRILSLVNEAVQSNLVQIGQNQYMTLTALCIKDDKVRYAGLHLDMLLYRAASQTVELIETQGVWIGIADNITDLLRDDEFVLHAGDVLLLYTDGFTEAKIDKGLIEVEGLKTIFADLAGRTTKMAALIEGLLAFLSQAVVRDDVTLVALRRLNAPSEVIL